MQGGESKEGRYTKKNRERGDKKIKEGHEACQMVMSEVTSFQFCLYIILKAIKIHINWLSTNKGRVQQKVAIFDAYG
jgi:hypothetical protein